MYFQRTTTVNVRIDQNTLNRPVNNAPTNWDNVIGRLATLPRSDKDIMRQQQRRKIIESVASQLNQDIPSDDDSFQRSQILSSTPVISTPRNGRVPQIHAPPRISVIPKRTPLRSNATLMNISTPRSNKKRSKFHFCNFRIE